MSVTVRAPAKFNLQLSVGAPRADGFHPLGTVYQAIGLYDDVTVSAAGDWSVEVTAEPHIDLGEVPAGEDNIAVRAARLLLDHHGSDRAVRIEIHKGIPVAGGLAGGSADAAATLVAVDRLFDLHTSDEDLLRLAGQLGSDVPFALLGGTAAGTGRGEIVDPVTDNGAWWWVVVGNEAGLSTPWVYSEFDRLRGYAAGEAGSSNGVPAISPDLLSALDLGAPHELARHLENDLMEPALAARADLRATVADAAESPALATLLSGSGPTILLLGSSADHAREIAAFMTERGHDRVWVATAPVAGAHLVTYA